MIGEDTMLRFSGVASGQACTVVLRAGTQQLLDEAERSLHDAFCVLTQTIREPRTVFGGGASEMMMSKAVDALIPLTQSGKKGMAIEGFSRALRALPTTIADNGGFDSCELVGQLRALHAQGMHSSGLDMVHGRVGDMDALGVVESLKSKRQVLMSAAEAAEMILRVDNIIKTAPRERKRH